MQKGFLLSVTMVFGLAAGSSFATDKGVYGDDDRREVYDGNNDRTMQRMARSSAAVIDLRSLVTVDKQSFKLDSESYGESERLCSDEAFYEQPTAAHCTSFLVAPDVVVSAGHCFADFGACESSAFVFDYSYYARHDQPERVFSEQIFTCKEILSMGVDHDTGLDYAIIRLDRPTEDRSPLQVNHQAEIKTGDAVTVIGNPSGLPTKISGGAKVRRSAHPVWFLANLDTFHGNSGSAVFNDKTGKVEGILVRGDEDFEYDEGQGCRRVKRCRDDGCQGEAVTKISAFYSELASYL